MLELAYRHDEDVYAWIVKNSMGVIEELNAFNFQILKATGMPMLLMFVDKNNVHHDSHLYMFERVAEVYEDVIKFGWMDCTEPIKAKKQALGLVTEILPAVAFNLLEDRQIAFDEGKVLNEQNLKEFVQNFLENKVSQFINKPTHQIDPELLKGYSNVDRITMEQFDSLVLTEGYDVCVMFYSSFNNQESYTLAPYMNKLAKRFKEMREEIPKVRVYMFDVSTQSVPKNVKMEKLPAIFVFPAFHKKPPYIQFTGDGKVLPIMFFIQKYSDIQFELPELPHLSPDQVDEYWKQVSELEPERQEKVSAANERREWDL